MVDTFIGLDHLPIETTFQLEAAIRTTLVTRKCFKRMDIGVVQVGAQWLWLLEG